MWNFDAWENALFNEYNGEGRQTEEEFWAEQWEELEQEAKKER